MAASIPNDTTSYLETRPVVKWETAEEVYRRQITTIWINTIDQISSSSSFFRAKWQHFTTVQEEKAAHKNMVEMNVIQMALVYSP